MDNDTFTKSINFAESGRKEEPEVVQEVESENEQSEYLQSVKKEKQRKLYKRQNSPNLRRRNSIRKASKIETPVSIQRKENSPESVIRLEKTTFSK